MQCMSYLSNILSNEIHLKRFLACLVRVFNQKKSSYDTAEAALFVVGSVNQESNEIIDNKVFKEFGEGDLLLSDVENDDLMPSKDKRGD